MKLDPLLPFHIACIELMKATPKTWSTHCFRSALHHLERAEALVDTDPAMAVFRAITAEEEAASGIMLCLRERKYPNHKHLRPRNHVHKHAVFPFLEIIGVFFGQTMQAHFREYRLHVKEEEGHKRLMLALPIALGSEERWAYPIPPLNFGVKEGTAGLAPDYAGQIKQFVAAKGTSDIQAFIKTEANLRNRILYAGPDGYPVVTDLNASFVGQRRARVLAMLQIFLLIQPYKEHQPYVSSALEAFLVTIGELERNAPPEDEV